MLLRSEVGTGRGADAVGRIEAVIAEERADSALDTRLEITLGKVDPVGRSDTADDRMLDSSEITDGTTDGRMPDADGDAVIAADVGAVGLADPELGMMPVGNRLPVTAETADVRIEDRLMSPELAEATSDVGIAPESETSLVGVAEADADSVPSAVVMPITIPLEGRPLEERTPVGSMPLLGRRPELMTGPAVGSILPIRDERRELIRPADVVGWTIDSEGGKRPVETTWDVGTASGL